MPHTLNQRADSSSTSNAGKWMALVAAILGWLFDGFEMGMFPLTGKPALRELLGPDRVGDVESWFGVIMAVFLIGAATGGVVFGWLGDRIGRVRAMSLSIFTYAIFTGLCGLASEAWHIAALRFIASLGMGGEWSLGVALVTELWPDKSRALLAGLIGAASNVGFLLVALISLGLMSMIGSAREVMTSLGLGAETVDRLLRNDAWRLLMIAGSLPALLIFFIRLFVPESHRWEQERDKGATSHWATRDLLGVLAGCAGAGFVVFLWTPLATEVIDFSLRIAGSLLGFCVAIAGYMYPVYRYLTRAQAAAGGISVSISPQIRRLLLGGPLAGVALLGTWGSIQWAPSWAIDLSKTEAGKGIEWAAHAKEYTQMASAIGAILGTIVAALVAGWLGRRITYTLLCLGSFAAVKLLFRDDMNLGVPFLSYVFLAGAVTAAFYGFFPLYLPELFPTRVRATSQGFAYNFGRVIAAVGTLQTAPLREFLGGSLPRACSALGFIYLIGVFIIWLGPETKGKPLPE